MPGPDPHSLWIEYDGTRFAVTYERYFWTQNEGNRRDRAKAILHRLKAGTWLCRWCGNDLPEYKRADALFCCEGCKRRAAKARRL